MSGYFDDDEQDQNGPKALRDALAKAKADLEQARKDLEAERATNAELSTKVKSISLRDTLSAAGVDPQYARFAERDGVEASEDAVKKWVEENKAVYAFLAPKATSATEDNEEPVDVIDPALEAGIAAGQQAEAGARPSGTATIIDTLNGTDLSQFKSEAEVDAYLRSLGAPRAIDA